MGKEKESNYEKEQHGNRKERYVMSGYVCANCDTDFGENDFGVNVKEGIHNTSCPICGCNILYVYHMVSYSERHFPVPTMNKEVLNLLQKQKDNRYFEHVVPSDGMHGVDVYDLDDDDDDDEKCDGCCSDDNDECDDCTTRARFPTLEELIASRNYEIRDLNEQVARERKARKEEFARVLKCMSSPVMEE